MEQRPFQKCWLTVDVRTGYVETRIKKRCFSVCHEPPFPSVAQRCVVQHLTCACCVQFFDDGLRKARDAIRKLGDAAFSEDLANFTRTLFKDDLELVKELLGPDG